MILALENTFWFMGFFLLFISSASFWGRIVLKLFKVQTELSYGEPILLVTFIGTLNFIVRYAFYFTNHFEILFLAFFIFGGIGASIELIFALIRSLRNKEKLQDIIHKFILSHNLLIVSLAFASIFAFYFCKLSISNTMEPWSALNTDYYVWLFLADYWRGLWEPSLYEILNVNFYLTDAFGIHVFIAYFGAARSLPSLMISCEFIVLIYSIIGTTIFSIVHVELKLSKIVAFLVGIGTVASSLFLFLAENGNFPHLAALLGYLVLLKLISKNFQNGTDDTLNEIKKYCFALLYLLTIYQVAFLVFLGMSLIFSFSLAAFKSMASANFMSSLWISLWKSIKSLLFSTLIIFILIPQVFLQFLIRTKQAVAQVTDISLNLLNPFIFSGIPLIGEGLKRNQPGVSWQIWAIFFVSIIILGYFVSFRKEKSCTSAMNALKAFIFLYVFSLIIYLLFYSILGNDYKVWKLSAYTALPLAFIPLSLVFIFFNRLLANKKMPLKIVYTVLTFSLSTILIIHLYIPQFIKFGFSKSFPLLSPIFQLTTNQLRDKDKSRIIYDFKTDGMIFLSAIMAESDKSQKIFSRYVTFLKGHSDYIAYLDPGTVLYTDVNHQGIINGKPQNPPSSFK
ncbi:MAG: hypothetical protein LBE27_05080, partial [Deltaproteobacteria bacterium]|nr:hypothetical protein [Deltaproteobacteria bacterium]